MSSKAFIPLIVGFGVGLLALKMGYDYIKKAEGAAGDTSYVEILVCNGDIPMSMEVTPEMVGISNVPTAVLPAQYFRADQKEEVIGRVASVMLSRGLPISPTSLAPPGTPPGLVVRIPAGLRAIAVKVAEEQQAGGWLVPGAKVDVSAVFTVKRAGRRQSETVSRVILQDVEVAAVGQSLGTENQENGPKVVKSVTLLVKPADVPKLHLAQVKGKLTFAVRGHRDDSTSTSLAGSSESELIDGVQPEEPKKEELSAEKPAEELATAQAEPVSEPFRVEIINGDSRKTKVYVSPDSRESIPSNGQKRSKRSKRSSRSSRAMFGHGGYRPSSANDLEHAMVQGDLVEDSASLDEGFGERDPELGPGKLSEDYE